MTTQLEQDVEDGRAGEYEQACERNLTATTGTITLDELFRHMEKHGPEGILESAMCLNTEDYALLKARVRDANKRWDGYRNKWKESR